MFSKHFSKKVCSHPKRSTQRIFTTPVSHWNERKKNINLIKMKSTATVRRQCGLLSNLVWNEAESRVWPMT